LSALIKKKTFSKSETMNQMSSSCDCVSFSVAEKKPPLNLVFNEILKHQSELANHFPNS